MRSLLFALLLSATSAEAVERDIFFQSTLGGCSKPDCYAEAQTFVGSGSLYLKVTDGSGERELLLRGDGTIAVGAPALPFVASRGVTAKLPRREAAAIFAALDQLRDSLAHNRRPWLDKPLSMEPGAYVTIAFPRDGDVHIYQGPATAMRRDYVPLLVALLPYLDAAAMIARSERVVVGKEVLTPAEWTPFAERLHAGEEGREQFTPPLTVGAEGLAERVVTTQETVDPAKTHLIGWKVVHEGPDHIGIALDFYYDGSHGNDVHVCGAVLGEHGNADTGCRPSDIRRGRHVACTIISTYDKTPDKLTTSTIRFPIYPRGGSTFLEVSVPYFKIWKKLDDPQKRCPICEAFRP